MALNYRSLRRKQLKYIYIFFFSRRFSVASIEFVVVVAVMVVSLENFLGENASGIGMINNSSSSSSIGCCCYSSVRTLGSEFARHLRIRGK